MNKNTIMFIVLSIAFGLGAVLIARNWLADNQPQNVTAGQVTVFTVNTELSTGTLLDPKYITSTTMPEELVPNDAITDKSQLEDMLVKQKLYKGDILRAQRLVKKGEGSSLASLIGKNKRAVSIRVNDVVGVAGFLLPGNKVDVLSTYETKAKRVVTDVILSNVKILAIDQRASNDENKPQLVRAVTLELDLAQAEVLMSARNKGSIQLALRNPNDEAETLDYLSTSMEEAVVEQQAGKNVTGQAAVMDMPVASSGAVGTSSEPQKVIQPRQKVEIIRGVKKESIQINNK
jgi:pilus assembly protein CpaB